MKFFFLQEYFSANRSMSILPVGIALMVSFMSAITLLGVSAENYTFGTQFVVINFAYLVGTPMVCYGFLPVFYKLQAMSAYEVIKLVQHFHQFSTAQYSIFKHFEHFLQVHFDVVFFHSILLLVTAFYSISTIFDLQKYFSSKVRMLLDIPYLLS